MRLTDLQRDFNLIFGPIQGPLEFKESIKRIKRENKLFDKWFEEARLNAQ